MPEAPTVFIVDDDEAVRDSLQILLETEGYRTEVFESAIAFLGAFPTVRQGCVVADVRMPDMTGLELQAALIERGLDVPIVIMTGHGDVPMAVRALKAGAIDFIEKPFTDELLLDSIGRALAAIDAPAQARERAAVAARLDTLTPRERAVLDRLVLGQAHKAIAIELGISVQTVDVHRVRLMTKLEVQSLSALVRVALAAGLASGE
jgi:two-component system response regulator FixJ